MTSRTGRSHCVPRSDVRTERIRRTTTTTSYPEPSYPSKAEYAQDGGAYNQEAAAGAGPRYNDSRTYQSECPSDDFKLSEASSNEAVSESCCTSGVEVGARESEPHYRDVGAAEPKQTTRLVKPVKLDAGYAAYQSPKHYQEPAEVFGEPAGLRASFDRRAPEYGDKRGYNEPASDPHSANATHKLQRLKELQWRRNLTEKYYSQEINRLIGDQYSAFENRLPGQPVRHAEKPLPQSYVGDRIQPPAPLSNLEQCGTMVTITRLDCGCVEQTTRPIYTTLSGQTQKRNCVQEQQVQMNLSSPTARIVLPTNHQPPRDPSLHQTSAKLRSKSFTTDTLRRTAANDHDAQHRSSQLPPPPHRRPRASSDDPTQELNLS